MVKVSVVMNTYNEKPEYLIKAIESYINQKDVDLELIVSTLDDDNNLDLIKKYPVKIALTKKSNHPGKSPEGSYLQINNALHLCTGKYFCFASSNDWADEYKLKNESDALESTGCKVCYSDFYLVSAGDAIIGSYNFAEYDYNRHKESNFIHDCSMVQMELMRKYLPFKPVGNFAFWDLWLRIYKGEDRGEISTVFHYLRYCTWYYRRNDESMSKLRLKSNDDRIQYNLEKERFINTYHR